MAPAADTVAAARAHMLAAISRLPPQPVGIGVAVGRTLAETVSAVRPQPPFRSAAMDGYAVRAADVTGAAFTVMGEAAAGKPYDGARLGPREAVRIFTGAPVPEGADLVVPQERARHEGEALWLEAASRPRSNIREAGLDFRAGDVLVRAGVRLNARHVALIAAAGVASVMVTRRPRIALLATGDEIVQPGACPAAHQIFDSVSFAVAALIGDWGGEALQLAIRPDDQAAIAAAAAQGLDGAELLVIIGGASVGDYDVVKGSLGALALQIAVPRIAIRPGKPTWFGRAAGKPVLGLPGNPAAALVCAHLFLRPLLCGLLGREPVDDRVMALLEGEIGASGPSESYLRAVATPGEDARLRVRPCADQDTSLVSVFASANALIRRPSGAPAAADGALVEVLLLDRP
jgi:molybdopterin molybdotransferase